MRARTRRSLSLQDATGWINLILIGGAAVVVAIPLDALLLFADVGRSPLSVLVFVGVLNLLGPTAIAAGLILRRRRQRAQQATR